MTKAASNFVSQVTARGTVKKCPAQRKKKRPKAFDSDRERGRALRVYEVAEELGLSEKTVREAIRNGGLPAFRIGKIFLIAPENLGRLRRGEVA